MTPKTDTQRLVSLGRTQTDRLAGDIVWNSVFLADYRNRYEIDPGVVYDFAEGYLAWLAEVFAAEIAAGDDDTLFKLLQQHFRSHRSGYSFYDYTHFIVTI